MGGPSGRRGGGSYRVSGGGLPRSGGGRGVQPWVKGGGGLRVRDKGRVRVTQLVKTVLVS